MNQLKAVTKQIEIEKAFIELLAPNLIFVTVKDNITLEYEDILEIKKINIELTKGQQYGFVSDTGDYTSATSEARSAFSTKNIEKGRVATALIINSLSQRLLANFFIKFNKPSVPIKLFSNKKEALEWVQNILINRSNTL